tara:strand:+ start:668 stop:1165 length:498 start_codon:yes stop_codon:yes gene_type:complete
MGTLLSPAFGTVFWATLAFLATLFILKKFAWAPILNALKEREENIGNALRSADKAREEMANLNSENERLLQEARASRDAMLKESREMADKLISDAKAKAKAAASVEVESAKEAIATERKAAVAELRTEVAKLSIDIAEQLVREELKSSDKQKTLVDKLISESTLN